MSKKRTSPDPEGKTNEQTNNDSDQPIQRNGKAKRAKLAFFVDTTLQDLPLELIERIFVRAIVMEVEEMHLVRSVWKEKADRAIRRLSSVCPDWSNILTTNFFQNELYRTLDRIVEKTIRLEILLQFPVPGIVADAISFQDELFVRCKADVMEVYVINVYDRNNMAEVKDVIELPGIEARGMAACNVSNCLYVLNTKREDHVPVVRITKVGEHLFEASPFISSDWSPSGLCVAPNGSIILSKTFTIKQLARIRVYDAGGSLQHKMKLSSDLCGFSHIISKSNGNFLVVCYNDDWSTNLTEIDMNGTILRQYQPSVRSWNTVYHADKLGRIAIVSSLNEAKLLDREFNLLYGTYRQQENGRLRTFANIHYNSERDEMVVVLSHYELIVCIFRFVEE